MPLTPTDGGSSGGASTPQVQTDWSASSGMASILNKPVMSAVSSSGSYSDLINTPVIPAGQVQSDWNAVSGMAFIANKPALFNGTYAALSGKPVLFDGNYNSLTNKPSIPSAQVNVDWTATTGISQVLNKPTFAFVASTGLYSDLLGRPTLFDGTYAALTGKPTLFDGIYSSLSGRPILFDGVYASLTGKPSLATVATTGSYLDLTNRPVIPAGLLLSNPTVRTLSLATAYQATDPTKATFVTINVTSTSSISLSGTSNNEGGIYIGATNAVATGTGSKVGEYKNSLGGALVVGLTVSSSQTQPYSVMLPAGWYWSVRQTVGTGMTIVSCFEQPMA